MFGLSKSCCLIMVVLASEIVRKMLVDYSNKKLPSFVSVLIMQ